MARRKTGDNQATDKKRDGTSGVENIPKVQADHNSVAIGDISISGDLSGSFTIGYTVEQVSHLLTQITSTYQPKPFDGRCPYKGLDVFEEEDARLFFGRERLVEVLLSRVKESRTVFITGPSGSGKSSLVRAGLIHALNEGAIKSLHSERWLYETMRPGREPVKELAVMFSRLKSPDLANYFQAHTNEVAILNECADSVLSGSKTQRFVLFIDQFEEVFTQIKQEEERLVFLNMLAQAGRLENGRVIILFAMRSDFISNCATYPALNELLSREFLQIGAMQPEELVSAIALPAKHVGLPIEEELIARIINDMKGEPGALPLMQFALKDLFDSQQRKGGLIALTLEDYLRHGGIHKSLERHADASLAALNEKEQSLARSIFGGLIEIGNGTSDARRTALFDELVPTDTTAEDIQAVVQKLADARLIITDEQAGKDTVTISHEKLIDAWPWLKKLINENRDAIALQNEIASDAKEWNDHKRDASYLYSGSRLGLAQEQVAAQKITLNGLAKDFIENGINASEAERKTKEVLRRRITIGLISGSTIALVLAGFAVVQMLQAQKLAAIALSRQLAAQAQSIYTTGNSEQPIAVLLAVRSMQLFPVIDSAQILQRNIMAYPISRMTHDNFVKSVAFSPNGKYVVSGSDDHTARVWEAATGKEVAHMVHENAVNSVAFSPDGNYVISGSYDGTARVWEAATGREVARMVHGNYVSSVAFSPAGNYVISGSYDNTARVWETATGLEVARTTYDREVISVAFSPDGKYVVAGSGDGSARVWEAATGKEVARITHMVFDNSIAFSPNGKYIVSGEYDGTARVWEAATGKEVAHFTHGDVANSVAFSPDGKYVVSGSMDGTARVWEVTTGKEVTHMTHNNRVNSVRFSPDGKYVISASDDHTARVWEADTGTEVARITHDDGVTSVAFGPDGKYVVSGSYDNTVRVWKVDTGSEIARLTNDSIVNSVAFSPDSKYVVAGSGDKIARVWEVSTGEEVTRLTQDDLVISLAFSPDGKYVVSGSTDGTARVWEATTGKEIARLTYAQEVTCVAFSPDGKYVVSGSMDGTARVWEAITGKEIARLAHDDAVRSVAFSPDGKYVVSGGDDTTVRVWKWEAATGKEVTRMLHRSAVSSVTFSPNGKYVVSGSDDGTARVWDVMTGKEVARMTHELYVNSVTFSPDGKYVVSGSADGTARVWRVTTGKEIAHVTHTGSVTVAVFSPDGKYVVSASDDHTARVWEADTGKEIARMVHDDSVNSVLFSPDGKYVASGSADTTVRVWLWQPKDLISMACAFLPRNLTRAEWKQYMGDLVSYQAICPALTIEPEPTATPRTGL